jgi:UDP-glucuronate decarboxylase
VRLPGPVNLGNPEELRVAALVQRVLALTGSPSKVVQRPLPVDDPQRRRPDIALARALLDWQPRTDLDSGLRATIAWFERDLCWQQAVRPPANDDGVQESPLMLGLRGAR